MKRLFLVAVGSLLFSQIWAYDFEVDGLYYDIVDDAVELTYQSTDKSNYSGLDRVEIPETVTYGGNTYSVTSIGRNAFRYCNLKWLSIPSTVTKIDSRALSGASAIDTLLYNANISDTYFALNTPTETLIIGDSVTKLTESNFAGCKRLKTVVVGNSVTVINVYAFGMCDSLETIKMGNSVRKIDRVAFNGCLNLTTINFPNSLDSIGEYAFLGCEKLSSVVLPDSIKYINGAAFVACDNLKYNESDGAYYLGSKDNPYLVLVGISDKEITEFTFKDETKLTLEQIFKDCKKLKTVKNFPSSITEIKDNMFCNCESLEGFTIPDAVTTIGSYAFECCNVFKEITIPASVEYIGEGAFSQCANLAEIKVDKNNKNFTSVDGVLFNADKTQIICYPSAKEGKYSIPDGVTSVMGYAFAGCPKLTDITIPASLNFEGREFVNCQGITSVEIPDGITRIGIYSFSNCKNLTSVTIPNSVTRIDPSAFAYSGLKSVTIPSSVTSVFNDVFYGCDSLAEIIVDKGNERYCSIDGVLFYNYNGELSILQYPSSKEGKVYDLPDGTTSISSSSSFYKNYKLEQINIPSTLKNINNSYFEYCYNLKQINVDKGNEKYISIDGVVYTADTTSLVVMPRKKTGSFEIPKQTRYVCSYLYESLDSYSVENGNEFFTTIDGVLYNADSTKLIRCPGKTKGDFVVPSKVSSCVNEAFAYCDELTGLTLHGDAMSLDFYGCLKLTKLVYVDSVNQKHINTIQVDTTMGYAYFNSVYSSGSFYLGDKPKPGYRFVKFEYEGDLTLEAGITITAVFEKIETEVNSISEEDNAVSSVVVFAYDNTIVVENATDAVFVFDVMGRLVCKKPADDSRIELQMQQSGIYIVKVGNKSQRVAIM